MSICLIHQLECYGSFSFQICGFLQAPDENKGCKQGCVRYYKWVITTFACGADI